MDDDKIGGCIVTGVVILIVFIVGVAGLSMWLGPQYNVWNSEMNGKAELAQADYNRQTKVVEARANLQAQEFNAQSEVIRARGVAQANNIVRSSISDEYIKYLWVQTLDKTDHTSVIYVPTEGNIPVMEAGRTVK